MDKERRRLAGSGPGYLLFGLILAAVAGGFAFGYLLAGSFFPAEFPGKLPEPGTGFQKTDRKPACRPRPGEAARLLEKRLQATRAVVDLARQRETLREGGLSWELVHLSGQYHNLRLLLQGLSEIRKTLKRDFSLACLVAVDPGNGICNLLLLSGRKVVLAGEFFPAQPRLPAAPAVSAPRLALIIDDMGRSLKVAREFSALPLPLTFAIFPHLGSSRRVASYLVDQGHDIMLHLPMEPRGWPKTDPGPGALFVSMGDEEFQRVLRSDLGCLPGIIGVNNHMGSRLTEDRGKMRLLMRVLKNYDLFFIDSRTIADTVAYQEAVAAGIPTLQRDVFLDNDPDRQHILGQFRILFEVARVRGYAVGIGHPYPETAAALREISELAARDGIEIVPLRELITRSCGKNLAQAGASRQ